MSDPEAAIERVAQYLAVRGDHVELETIHDISLGSLGHVRLTSTDLRLVLDAARQCVPVTAEEVAE